jgi:hypothetical protein
MSATKNSFQLNLLDTITSTSYTATFSDIDNITVNSQSLRYAEIGSLKVVYGTMICTGTQDNQALGSHRVSLPTGFFTTFYTCSLTMGQTTAYQSTAHAIDQTDFDTIQIAYSQGLAPGSTANVFTINLLVIGA